MTDTNPIALLPLDNRPISYLLPKQIAEFSGTCLILPERKFLGDLNKRSDLNYMEQWLNGFCRDGVTPSLLIISLDNWVYGGLIQSRKHSYTLDDLKQRVEKLKQFKKTKYGFSSIMRIANYNSSEEEKDYWKDYGKKIFCWSGIMHKVGRGIKEGYSSHEELLEQWYASSKEIPTNVLADYKAHRDKNFTINLMWLESLHEHSFEHLIFSCDDSSKYGMNVVEAEYLNKEISKHNFKKSSKVISGIDEISLVLLTKVILEKSEIKPTVSPYFSSIEGKNHFAKYESNTIYKSVLDQIETVGLKVQDFNDSDICVCVHLADSVQGDHVFAEKPSSTSKNVESIIKLLEETNKPFILIDLAYANGADPNLIDALINAKINWGNCYGYSAWNTCSNSIGSALAIGINRWIAEKKGNLNEKEFKKCLLIRFLDDYAYQTVIRHPQVTEEEINTKIKPCAQIFSKILALSDINIKCTLPWGRSFEVEIDVL